MDRKILGVGPRTAEFLRQRYPKSRAKLIARDFGVSIGTAERWLRGAAPTVAHIEQMTALFGEEYVRVVFAEAFASQDQRVAALEASIVGTFVAGGLAGILAGTAYAHGLLNQGATIFSSAVNWAVGFIGLSPSHQLIEFQASPERVLLIEGLIETVPALPAP
ncbi:hypothetical protein [Roseomonas sp. KE2513]|uniref:hypothetical protein n=1 Tax=Roseomonas sp. KE2513 TaxID=2479202 RepID=UPI0018DF6A68|nr:hypothetical protein [Roseomonas sp. KE2513]